MWCYILPILLLSGIYYVCILLLIYSWDRHTVQRGGPKSTPIISIVIAARNEESNIEACIRSLLQQSYPEAQTEIIVVDDFSTDNSYQIATTFSQVKVLRLKDIAEEDSIRSGKKQCLEYGIQQAQGEYILLTDADCIASPHWVRSTMSAFEELKADVICGTVCIEESDKYFNNLQALDLWSFLALTASTIGLGHPILANGANFAFRKKLFFDVNGFEGSKQISSGDDIFLLHKFNRYGAKTSFNKSIESLITTHAEDSLLDFMNQRIRWASKTASYRNIATLFVIIMFYTYYLSFPFLLIFAAVHPILIKWLAGALLAKSFIDFVYLRRVLNFFKKTRLLQLFLPAQFFHLMYVLITGAVALFIPVRWKGRKLYR